MMTENVSSVHDEDVQALWKYVHWGHDPENGGAPEWQVKNALTRLLPVHAQLLEAWELRLPTEKDIEKVQSPEDDDRIAEALRRADELGRAAVAHARLDREVNE